MLHIKRGIKNCGANFNGKGCFEVSRHFDVSCQWTRVAIILASGPQNICKVVPND
jgi:hypothetical protein